MADVARSGRPQGDSAGPGYIKMCMQSFVWSGQGYGWIW